MSAENVTFGSALNWKYPEQVARDERAQGVHQLLEVSAPDHLISLRDTHEFFDGQVFLPPIEPMSARDLAALTVNPLTEALFELAEGLFYLDHDGRNVNTGLVWDMVYERPRNEVKGKGVMISSRPGGDVVIRIAHGKSLKFNLNTDLEAAQRNFRPALEYACTVPGSVSFPAGKVSKELRAAVIPTSIPR